MKTIEGTARFDSEQKAQAALARLFEIRHDPGNDLVGGAAEVRGDTVHFSFRHPLTTAKKAADTLGKQIDGALKDAKVDKSTGEVVYDEETYVDPETGEVKAHQANRVIQVFTDDDGREQTRVLFSKTRLVRAIDDETGEEIGRVPVRTVTDEHGNKVSLGGDRVAPEQNVIVETGV